MGEDSKQQHPASLHASGEGYLETTLILHMKKGTMCPVDVTRRLGASKPSVCHTVTLLKGGGFLTIDEDFSLCLADVGREITESTYERHCFFTEKLIAARIDPKVAEADTCRTEYIIGTESLEWLKEVTKGMR